MLRDIPLAHCFADSLRQEEYVSSFHLAFEVIYVANLIGVRRIRRSGSNYLLFPIR